MTKAAATPRFVAYLRVSTVQQGRSGLGLEAQREAVRQFVAGRSGRIIAPEFVEVETGKRSDRPQLQAALKRCRSTGATLVVAKLDRLSRNAAFLMTLRDAGVQFVAADMPEANTLTIGLMAVMAQHEREAISARTVAALAAAKRRGVNLGGLRKGAPDISEYQQQATAARQANADQWVRETVAEDLRAMAAEGLSLNEMARRLNAAEVRTRRGGVWSAAAVSRAVARL